MQTDRVGIDLDEICRRARPDELVDAKRVLVDALKGADELGGAKYTYLSLYFGLLDKRPWSVQEICATFQVSPQNVYAQIKGGAKQILKAPRFRRYSEAVS